MSPKARSWLVLAALGDSLLGAEIAEALRLPRDSARDHRHPGPAGGDRSEASEELTPFPSSRT